ncbi:MAG: glycosyltransferase family 2 protein [Burkholderiales bacterium]|nr:MAG: glycosyltransferase family 2 protein [Burkholderiales bacterium]
MDTISVVIPAYNAAPYISETLQSIFAQSLPPVEIIVVDDCSKDNTHAVVAALVQNHPYIKLIRAPRNFGGPAGPRNMGVKAAQGHLIAFCDADDIWHQDKLKLQMQAYLTSRPAIVGCAVKNFRQEDPHALLNSSSVNCAHKPVSYWTMLCKDVIAMSGVMCERSVLVSTGFFDEAKEYVSVEDYQLWLRILQNPALRAVKLNSILVAYRILNTSLSSNRLKHMRKIRKVVFRQLISAHGWVLGLLLQPLVLIGYVYLAIYWRWLKKGL